MEENDENKSVEPLSLQEKYRRDLIKSVKPLLKPYFYNSMRNTVLLYYCLESFDLRFFYADFNNFYLNSIIKLTTTTKRM